MTLLSKRIGLGALCLFLLCASTRAEWFWDVPEVSLTPLEIHYDHAIDLDRPLYRLGEPMRLGDRLVVLFDYSLKREQEHAFINGILHIPAKTEWYYLCRSAKYMPVVQKPSIEIVP